MYMYMYMFTRDVTYQELQEQVCKIANVLKGLGVQRGDPVHTCECECVCVSQIWPTNMRKIWPTNMHYIVSVHYPFYYPLYYLL